MDFFPNTFGIPPVWFIVLSIVVAAGILTPTLRYAGRLGWQFTTYVVITVGIGLVGIILWQLTRNPVWDMGITYVIGMLLLAIAGMGLLLGFVEFGVMRLLGFFRLGAISYVTYYEALRQPFTLLILLGGLVSIGVTARLGFFTYNEDFKMYRDVASSFVFLFALPIMVFASTKVIDEEIENRTMLTLMSKPISRTEVVLGKYMGVMVLIFVCVGILAIMAAMCSYLRYFDDMSIDFRIASNDAERVRLLFDNQKAFLALLPSVVLTFLQVATLAAISVAISTRFGLAVNVTTVVIIYIAASMARYVGGIQDLPYLVKGFIAVLARLLPGLTILDLNQRLVFSNYILNENKDWAAGLPTYGLIWQYVGVALIYSLFYIAGILSFGIALFRSRELT
ncbi:MAG TPA: ABC transporter permease [Phycisphaerae bacterium]|jgi:hypothetical protein